MKRVITYGSFDLFHEGHYRLLERAKKLGDYLIVGVTTEQYDAYRGKVNVIDSLMERIENVKNTGFVDEIVIEDHPGQKVEDIQKYNIDIFTVGSDWRGKFEYLKQYCDVTYLERTKDISSTIKRQAKYKIIKIGVIGSGRIANRFIPEAKYVSGVTVEGVYNPNINSAKKYGENHELNFYTDNLQELFSKVDAVYIASPHSTHYEYIKKALEMNKHILCEKPIVLKESEAGEVYSIAKDKNLVLMEGIKTAYCPGFLQLLSIARSGQIGEIKDVEASFTKLSNGNLRELTNSDGGSVTELASYVLLAIIKLLGANYNNITFKSFVDDKDIDLYTKIDFIYNRAVATAKIGLGVKSEGSLLISGTNGYIYVQAPWWKTEHFEVRYEDSNKNERFFTKFEGDGLRYELSDFVSRVNGNNKSNFKLKSDESIEIIKIINMFLQGTNCFKIKY